MLVIALGCCVLAALRADTLFVQCRVLIVRKWLVVRGVQCAARARCVVQCRQSHSRSRPSSSDGPRAISYPLQTTEEDLRDRFGRYGKLNDVFLPRDRDTRKPKGFGFVTFDVRADAEDAVKAQDGYVYSAL